MTKCGGSEICMTYSQQEWCGLLKCAAFVSGRSGSHPLSGSFPLLGLSFSRSAAERVVRLRTIEVHVGAGFQPALAQQTRTTRLDAFIVMPSTCVCRSRAGLKPAPTSLLICALPPSSIRDLTFQSKLSISTNAGQTGASGSHSGCRHARVPPPRLSPLVNRAGGRGSRSDAAGTLPSFPIQGGALPRGDRAALRASARCRGRGGKG